MYPISFSISVVSPLLSWVTSASDTIISVHRRVLGRKINGTDFSIRAGGRVLSVAGWDESHLLEMRRHRYRWCRSVTSIMGATLSLLGGTILTSDQI